MIYDEPTDTVLGNSGWVDRGALWIFSARSESETRIEIKGAQHLGLRSGDDGFFRLTHHQSPDLAVSIRHRAAPEVELASIRFDGDQYRYLGDFALWSKIDPAVIIQTDRGPKLVLIDAPGGQVIPLDLSWFNEANYDLLYQGLVDCMTIRDGRVAVVATQRSSKLILINIEANALVGSIMLAGRGGNPTLVALSKSEFVATDYDILCVVDGNTGAVRHSLPLQNASAQNARQFVGDFDVDGTICAVARPFSGDVALVDLKNFEIIGTAPTSGQPLSICLLSGSRFLTRDWKTGTASLGMLPRL